jgi:hypothetical protein
VISPQKVDSLRGLLDEREAIKFSVLINSFAMIIQLEVITSAAFNSSYIFWKSLELVRPFQLRKIIVPFQID